MTRQKKIINVNAEINHANDELGRSLERSAMLAEIAYSLGKLPPDLILPDSNIVGLFRSGSSGEFKQTWSNMKDMFSLYCTRYAIVGMITSCEIHLQRLYFIAKLAKAVNQSGGTIVGQEFLNIKKRCLKEVRHMAVDRIVETTFKTLGVQTPTLPLLDGFRSICNMRRCLLHRDGIIGQEDVGEEGKLTTIWRKPILIVDGEDIAGLPIRVDGGQVLGIRFSDETKEWHLGEKLEIDVEGSQHIAFTLMLFAKELSGELINEIATICGAK